MVKTGRHGLRRPILVQFLLLLNSLPSTVSMTDRHSLRLKTLNLSEYGYWDYFSKLHDEPAGRTVIDTMDRHGHDGPSWNP